MDESQASSQRKEKTPEQKAKWAAYIREYRKNRKLATEAANAIGSDMGTPEDGSSIPGDSTQAA